MTRTWSDDRFWLVLCIALALARVLWIGDISFVDDEPQLIEKAMKANAAGSLETVGLKGNRGFYYGPLPVWTYQALLVVSRDPVTIAALRCLVFSGLLLWALVRLVKALDLPLAMVALTLGSPYLWVYSRLLWDNTLLIPLSALLFAGVCELERQRAEGQEASRGSVVTVWLTLLLMPMVHLMSAAVLVPVGVFLILRHARAMLRRWRELLMITLPVCLLSLPYLRSFQTLHAEQGSRTGENSLVFSLKMGRFFSAGGLDYFYGPQSATRFLGGWAEQLTRASGVVGHLLLGAGALLALRAAWPWLARRRPLQPVELVRASTALLALAVFVAQTALNVATETNRHPHYYNATWVAGAVLIWLACEQLLRFRAGQALVLAHAVVLLGSVGVASWHLHQTGGDQREYGPTLSNQMTVATELARIAPREVKVTSVYLLNRPKGLQLCQQLAGFTAPGHGPVVTVAPESNQPEVGRLVVRVKSERGVRPGDAPVGTPASR